jgi:radical SAM-linked protein
MKRYRVLYSKTEPLRYTGMLDIQHIWERLFRRAHLDLAYSHGFHPQPRIQQAAPLPLSYLSNYEVLDFWLEGESDSESIFKSIRVTVQPGLEIQHLEEVDPPSPPLQTLLEFSTYVVTDLVGIDPNLIEEKIALIIKERSIIRERRNKTYDLRPLINEIKFNDPFNNLIRMEFKLSAREAATGRPDELIAALGYDPLNFRYLRTYLKFPSPIFVHHT